MDEYIREKTKRDFDSAYTQALFSRILNKIKGERTSLLSLHEIMKYVKVKNEIYKGMQFIQIKDIIGSEGRYNDFNNRFLPRRKNLRARWQRVDEAHYKDVILPAIQLYKLGDVYFVRDGNHRVSVAKKQGREFIDAEVIEIKTDYEIRSDMTEQELIQIIEEHEREIFLEETGLAEHRHVLRLRFSSTGRYNDLRIHINDHRYYLGIEKDCEIDYRTALLSWFDNLFTPIIKEIDAAHILPRFPKRTAADLYVWIIRHWDELKNKYGNEIQIVDAVHSYNKKFGKSLWIKIMDFIHNLFKSAI